MVNLKSVVENGANMSEQVCLETQGQNQRRMWLVAASPERHQIGSAGSNVVEKSQIETLLLDCPKSDDHVAEARTRLQSLTVPHLKEIARQFGFDGPLWESANARSSKHW